jgi:hypothetical protein
MASVCSNEQLNLSERITDQSMTLYGKHVIFRLALQPHIQIA